MRQPQFGKSPQGERLERIKASPNFKEGSFKNINFTPFLSDGYSMTKITLEFVFKTFPRTVPKSQIPSVKTDLKNLSLDQDVLIWFGHSSYYFQLNGKRFLVDPVFSGSASPISFTTKSFAGTDFYQAEDFPEIDYLLISHDHYDHLDYKTIKELKPKIKQVICGLGVGSHFEYWGFEPGIIHEKDWNEQLDLGSNLTLHTATARHFSGRSFTRNNTLWMSYLLEAGDFKVYIGGDSGYDTHFAAIGEKFDGVDLAILDNGQYNLAWKEIHMLPEEVLKASRDLGAKRLFPVHSSKFVLANHAWDEPLNKVSEYNEANFVCPLVTPRIGEIVYLKDSTQKFSSWWREIS